MSSDATQFRQLKIKCIDYELKSADNPSVLTKFCKLLSLTYYRRNAYYLLKIKLALTICTDDNECQMAFFTMSKWPSKDKLEFQNRSEAIEI